MTQIEAQRSAVWPESNLVTTAEEVWAADVPFDLMCSFTMWSIYRAAEPLTRSPSPPRRHLALLKRPDRRNAPSVHTRLPHGATHTHIPLSLISVFMTFISSQLAHSTLLSLFKKPLFTRGGQRSSSQLDLLGRLSALLKGSLTAVAERGGNITQQHQQLHAEESITKAVEIKMNEMLIQADQLTAQTYGRHIPLFPV